MFQAFSYILYWLKQQEEHSLHSPFLFDFYTQVIRTPANLDLEIEDLRKRLKSNKKTIQLLDLGAGSRVSGTNERSIESIARNSSTPPSFSSCLSRIIEYFNYSTILELGTSLGLNTLYLSKSASKVYTMEGDPSLSKMAQAHFDELSGENIELITGNIDNELEPLLERLDSIDLVYLDANHTEEATISYYEAIQPKLNEKGIIVIDDIHWSSSMSKAWHQIKTRPEVIISIDLFEAGLLFFDPNLDRGDYTLKF